MLESFDNKLAKCKKCKKYFEKDDLMDIILKSKSNKILCNVCLSRWVYLFSVDREINWEEFIDEWQPRQF